MTICKMQRVIRILRQRILAGWVGLVGLLFGLSPILRAAEPFPVTQLYALPRFTNPKLSPDGAMMCAIVRNGESQSLVETIFNGATPREIAVFNGHARLEDFWWSGTDLLLLVTDEKGASAFRSLDLRTGKINFLESLPFWESQLLQWQPDKPETFLVEYDADYGRSMGGLNLGRLNVHTGKMSKVKLGVVPFAVQHWIVNEKGEAVAGRGALENKAYYLWRSGPDEEWQRRELGTAEHPDLVLVGIHPDQKRIIAYDYTTAGPAKVVAFDPATMKKETIFENPEVDPDNIETWGQDMVRLRAIRYEVDRPAWHFLDAGAEAIMQSIDAALPDTVNEIQSASADEQIMIITASSDRDRGSYFLLDRTKKRLIPLGRQYAGDNPAGLTPGRRFEFKSRDGLTLHGRLFLPLSGGTKPPLVVIGSPWFATPRVRLGFEPWVQFLASHGYAVAQLETRGTSGYGRAMLKAGDFQIDTGIPNDLADGTRKLIEAGMVDGRRVALLGEQWGGLIVIHAIEKNPGLFSLWLNLDTPVDLRYLRPENLSLSTSDFRTVVKELGGRSVGEELLKRLDPTELVPKIPIPSFHYYQGLDGSYYAAGHDMKKLLEKGSANHVLFDNRLSNTDSVEEHEAKVRERTEDFAQRLLAFLDERLKPAR